MKHAHTRGLGDFLRRHCTEFKASDIWFLEPNADYEDRRLQLGVCPLCNKEVGELFESRKADGFVRSVRLAGKKLLRLKKQEINNIVYSSQHINRKNFFKKTFGWVFGISSSVKTKSGNVKIRQYACDFFGRKELVKTI